MENELVTVTDCALVPEATGCHWARKCTPRWSTAPSGETTVAYAAVTGLPPGGADPVAAADSTLVLLASTADQLLGKG